MGHGTPVTFESVSKRYGATDALVDFSLHVAAGEFVTLLGPSGSGKTTALNILAGFTDASAGRVTIGDDDVTAKAPEARNLGMVFQSFALFPHMSVLDNVAFPLKMRGAKPRDAKERARKTLERVHLDGFERRRPSELSGGQKQRVALARALSAEPPVLLMDECLSALDLKLREALQLEIKSLHREAGTTILFVTHDQGEAMALSDRIAVMRNGGIVQVDTPEGIYARPADGFVAGFVGRTNFLALDGRGLEGVPFASAPDWPDGTRAISVRPDRIGFASDRADAFALPARIEEHSFLGETRQFVARLQNGKSVLVRTPANTTVPKVGEDVTLAFEPADATPLAETPQPTMEELT